MKIRKYITRHLGEIGEWIKLHTIVTKPLEESGQEITKGQYERKWGQDKKTQIQESIRKSKIKRVEQERDRGRNEQKHKSLY